MSTNTATITRERHNNDTISRDKIYQQKQIQQEYRNISQTNKQITQIVIMEIKILINILITHLIKQPLIATAYLAFWHLIPTNKHPNTVDTITTDAQARNELNESFDKYNINTNMIEFKLMSFQQLKTLIAEYCVYLAFGPQAIESANNLETIH